MTTGWPQMGQTLGCPPGFCDESLNGLISQGRTWRFGNRLSGQGRLYLDSRQRRVWLSWHELPPSTGPGRQARDASIRLPTANSLFCSSRSRRDLAAVSRYGPNCQPARLLSRTSRGLGTDAPDREAWLARLAAPWTLVAVSEEAITGFGQLRTDGRVDYLYVHAEHQREGIGSLLLESLIESGRAHGLENLTVEASITARPFFERHGFELAVEQRVHRRGVDFVNFLMDRSV